MVLNQLVQEHQAGGAAVNDNAAPVSGTIAREQPASEMPHVSRPPHEPTPHGETAEGEATEARAADQVQDEEPESHAQMQGQAMQRFLSAQTDVSEEVRRLYQLVCTGFR